MSPFAGEAFSNARLPKASFDRCPAQAEVRSL
jgi:hypothetical protein